MKNQKFYKVVTLDSEGLFSAFLFNKNTLNRNNLITNKLQIEYTLLQWTYPKIKSSKLFVFNSLSSIRDWSYFNVRSHLIYECEVKNPSKIKIMGYPGFFEIRQLLENRLFVKLWRYKRQEIKEEYMTRSVPKGTYVADAVKLIKKVKI